MSDLLIIALELAEIFSSFLTPASIVLPILVLFIYAPRAYKVWIKRESEPEPIDWLALGITFTHGGTIFDNIWWGSAWMMKYIDFYFHRYLFDYGVLSNIPFRNIAGIIGSYCHIRGGIKFYESSNYQSIIRACFYVGFIITALLIYIKYAGVEL